MKIKFIAAAMMAVLAAGAWAQQTIETGATATFDLRAHTKVGYDFDSGTSGMETSIDQIGIWFELFPYADTRGVPKKESDQVTASIRLDGSKFALKWFDDKKLSAGEGDSTNQDQMAQGGDDGAFTTLYEFSSMIAELNYKTWWFRVAGTEPSMYRNLASLKSIFDDVIGDASNSLLFSSNFLRMNRNLLSISDKEIPMTGMLSAGGDLKNVSFNVRAGSKANWEDNADNAWILGGDCKVTPVDNLALTATGLSSFNYDEYDETTGAQKTTNPVGYGFGAEYQYFLTDLVVLKPFVGFDGKYETVTEKSTWEVGGGVFLYWKGTSSYVSHDEIYTWGTKFPIGLSLSANVSDANCANVQFSLFEEAGKDAVIENLGGFIELEAQNLTAAESQDSSLVAAAQIEYLVRKKFRPYVFGEYAQGYKAGKLTEDDTLTSRVGIVLTPVKRFTMDVRYERVDHIGAVNDTLDPGVFTTNFKMKL